MMDANFEKFINSGAMNELMGKTMGAARPDDKLIVFEASTKAYFKSEISGFFDVSGLIYLALKNGKEIQLSENFKEVVDLIK